MSPTRPRTGESIPSPANAQFRLVGALHRALYRLGIGRSLVGMPVLILKTMGRRSGREIETPLTYFTDDGVIFVVASKGGDPRHPGWFHNLVAQPDVRAVVDGRERALRAEPITEGAERDRLFATAVAAYQGYAGYGERTTRTIPVVRLLPRTDQTT